MLPQRDHGLCWTQQTASIFSLSLLIVSVVSRSLFTCTDSSAGDFNMDDNHTNDIGVMASSGQKV